MKTMLVEYVAIALPIFVMVAIAVKQIAFILKYGSIFDGMRDSIRNRAQNSSRKIVRSFWIKIDQLFSCNLCLTAQVSIWFTTIPISIILFTNDPHFFMGVLDLRINLTIEILMDVWIMFMFTMFMAGLAYMMWNLFEYLPKKLKIAEQAQKAQTEIQTLLTLKKTEAQPVIIQMANPSSQTIEPQQEPKKSLAERGIDFESFAINDLKDLISFVESELYQTDFDGKMKCDDIHWCSGQRNQCREANINKFMLNWYSNKEIDEMEFILKLSGKVKVAVRKYYETKKRRPMKDYYGLIFDRIDPFKH